MEQGERAIRERDLALAMHETFLGSGSEDALSPRFQSLEIRSSPSSSHSPSPSHSPTPRTPRAGAGGTTAPSGLGGTVNRGDRAQKWEDPEKLDDESYLRRMRETEFEHHETGAIRLNNGSFGACPKSVLLRQEEWVRRWLRQPDQFYYENLEQGLTESRRVVASHVRCPVEELVLLDNVTEAAAVVAMDVMWGFVEGRYQKGDAILLINFAYGAVRKAFEAYAVRAGAEILDAEIPFPVASSAGILDSFEKALRGAKSEGRVIRLAVFDHVVSMPSIILPVKELVAMCRGYGVEQVFVDGAQAMGNVEVDVGEIGADYYAGNLHKWLFAPSTVAFFHCKPEHLSRLHHPIVSFNYGKGLVAECEWVGTKDYSPKLVVPAAFDFVNKLPGGLEAVRAYNHKKVIAAGKMLAAAWGTQCGVAPELCAAMVMVGLPPGLRIQSADDTSALRTRLRHEFSIEVHTFTPPRKEGEKAQSAGVTAHVRISHQIYNTWDEYLRLRDSVKALAVEKSKH